MPQFTARSFAYSVLAFTLSIAYVTASAQTDGWLEQMDSGRNTYGPYHRPITLRNEYGTDDIAVLVYKDKYIEMYVPDVTDSNGYMRLRTLDHFGTFMVMTLPPQNVSLNKLL